MSRYDTSPPVPKMLRHLLALALLAPPVASEAQPRLDQTQYRELVEKTASGLFMSGGRQLTGFREDSVEEAMREFARDAPGALRLKAASMLHTEGALGAGASRHLDFARGLIRAIPDPAEREDWHRRWWLAVGYSYHLALNTAAAVAHFEKGVEVLPGEREMRLALARVAQMAGRHREEPLYSRRAVEVLTGLLEEDPEDAEVRIRLAGSLFDIGDLPGAERQLARLEGARIPPYPRLAFLLLRGEIAMDAGDYPAAEVVFAEAVARARRSPAAVSGLVAVRLAQGNKAGAFEAASTYLSRRPAEWAPEWHFWLGPAIGFQEMFGEMRREIVAGFGEELRADLRLEDAR